MIAHLRGKPVLTGDRWVVIDVGGIGYQVQVTQPALQLLVHTTEPVKLFTYMAVREDAITLYGFMHQSELEMFRILIGVSGIGPQIAMNLLSQIGIEDFAHGDPERGRKSTYQDLPALAPRARNGLSLNSGTR